MAYINKVLYNIDQTGDTTSAEKKQARDNIEASQVNYINAISPTPTITPGDLNLVTYQSGLHLNDGVGNIAPCLPEPTSANGGQIATVTSEGVKWKANQPHKDVFVQSLDYDMRNDGSNTQVVYWQRLPTYNGKTPTKVIGSFDCFPNDNKNSLSVVDLDSYNTMTYQGVIANPYQCVNVNGLLALSDDDNPQLHDGQYRNNVTFSFYKTPGQQTNLTFIGIKGQNGAVESDYHIRNFMVTCFYEDEDGES